MTTVHRIYNFSAGPAVLPVPVLEEIQQNLMALPGVGMSILEISHRSAPFEAILAQAEADIRALANIPSTYKVLFLQGGASTQFAMVPLNLLTAGTTADYIDSGSWAEKAIKEAKKVGAVNVAATSSADNYSRIPKQSELKLTPNAAYVHMTSNNTIEGTEYKQLPDVGSVPLVSDTSSDMFSRPIDVARHALIYAGAQKNMGPAGVTVVIIREDLLARSTKALPTMMNYAVPKADDFIGIELARTETPTPVNPLGIKGAGETGTIASTAACANAVMDALAPFGIQHMDMPLTPGRIWEALRERKA